jgi:cytochrome c oxidase subunit II
VKPSTTVPSLLGPIFLSGCDGMQSALHPQGSSAIELSKLIWAMIGVCTIVWLLVMLALVAGIARSRRNRLESDTNERSMSIVVTGATIATAAVIAGLTLASFYTTRSLASASDDALVITVRGQQWWWQLLYHGDGPAKAFETANELHIPVGRDVRLQLEAPDVIHSFWVPSLAGKQDLVPGRHNSLTIRAERPGVYRGQCAEFCGMQHSHMAIYVIAEDEADYRRWEVHQRQNAETAKDSGIAAGREVFMRKPCAACHTIRGTQAAGTAGPDLTHIASRRTIAAGLIDNTRGAMAAWIADPQTMKPGNNMPLVELTSDELRQLSAYMESLK